MHIGNPEIPYNYSWQTYGNINGNGNMNGNRYEWEYEWEYEWIPFGNQRWFAGKSRS